MSELDDLKAQGNPPPPDDELDAALADIATWGIPEVCTDQEICKQYGPPWSTQTDADGEPIIVNGCKLITCDDCNGNITDAL